ncbi:NACHT domain-containing protein [Streptomyces sp. NBC_00390]|uniref:NACHT domain-containing protein n=1 Tax=Streptomyces sp. NBC_00390 TaxID=2975736 RepID=UPI002E1F783F
MGTGRGFGLAWAAAAAALCGIALVLGARVLPAAGTGDVDPAGALLGLVGLAATAVGTLWSGRMAYLALRLQESDAAGLADRLAREVKRQEEQARRRLLGGSIRSIDVSFAFEPAPAHNAEGAAPHGILGEVADYYRALRPGRLVITGAPGAGKTVLALHLMMRLLEERRPGEAVAVRMTLSGFDPTRQTLEKWITERLVRDYPLGTREARLLMAARLVLPILDGLDEMDEEDFLGHPTSAAAARATAALHAMNAYLDGTALGQLVVTCRSAPYSVLEAEEVWAQDAARIMLRPVTAEAAWDFLVARTAAPQRWEPVLDALAQHPDGPLARALSTPWRLTVAAIVYDRSRPSGIWDRYPTELLDPALDTEEKIRDHLLGLLVPAATAGPVQPGADHAPAAPYTPDRVHAWLTVLALYLQTNTVTGREISGRLLPGTDLVLHEMWPLAGSNRARVAHAALAAVLGFIALPGLLTPGPLFLTHREILQVIGIMAMPALMVMATYDPWQEPTRMSLTGLKTLRELVVMMLVAGLAMALVSAVKHDLATGAAFGLAALASTLGVALWGKAGNGGLTSRGIVRGDLMAGLAGGLGGALVATLVIALAPDNKPGPEPVPLSLGLCLGLMIWITTGRASARYLCLLLCTRRLWARVGWLPWGLGRFLDWCCEAGLMRTAGLAYQFRHRELQDYLARTAAP